MAAPLALLAAVGAPRDWGSFSFEEFKISFNRSYFDAATEDVASRQFEASRSLVLAQNAEYAAGRSTWWAAINAFSDMSESDFSATKKGLGPRGGFQHSASAFSVTTDGVTPFSVDWRDQKSPGGSPVVTPVKDQGGCGSCWAFASTATIESYYAMSTDELAVLAPQTLVSCAPNPDDCGGTGGCEGSIPELAFNYTKHSGIALEADLPYHAHDDPCGKFQAAATLDGYVKLPANSADALEATLATVGPVAVNVAANWQHYGGGIFKGGCTADSCTLDHVVVATGYRKDVPLLGGGYWLIRNSWGAGWGEDGYIRLTRGFDSTTFVDRRPASGVACKPFPKTQNVTGESGVLLDMSYPTGVRKWA